MKFYKSITIPCTVSIPTVQKTAPFHRATLLACNSADITDFCQEELDYIGPESQTLLFWIHASSEGLADQELEALKIALLRQSFVVGMAYLDGPGPFYTRKHAHITIATEAALALVSALIDDANNALSDLEDGYSLATVEKHHFVVSASGKDGLALLTGPLSRIEGVTFLSK